MKRWDVRPVPGPAASARLRPAHPNPVTGPALRNPPQTVDVRAREAAPVRARAPQAEPHRGGRSDCAGAGRRRQLLEELGADEAVDYGGRGADADFWARVPVPALGAGQRGYSVVVDCVGGDDYWEVPARRSA